MSIVNNTSMWPIPTEAALNPNLSLQHIKVFGFVVIAGEVGFNEIVSNIDECPTSRTEKILSELVEMGYINYSDRIYTPGDYKTIYKTAVYKAMQMTKARSPENDYFNTMAPVFQQAIERKVQDAPVFRAGDAFREILDLWNSAPGCNSKHDIKRKTKTLVSAKKLYNQLINGTFTSWRLSDSLVASFPDKRAENLKKVKILHEDVLAVVENGLKIYMNGYRPMEKDKMSKSLSDFFYNPHSGWSWFLFFIYNEPIGANHISEDMLTDFEKKVMIDYLGQEVNQKTYKDVTKGIDRVIGTWKDTMRLNNRNDESYSEFYRRYTTAEGFLISFFEWIKGQAWINSNASVSAMTGKLFDNFCMAAEKESKFQGEEFRVFVRK